MKSLQSRNRVIQISNRQIDDHTCDLGGILLGHHVCHIAEDESANHLLLLLLTLSHELVTLEDTHDLVAVLGALSLMLLGHVLLGHRGNRHRHRHLLLDHRTSHLWHPLLMVVGHLLLLIVLLGLLVLEVLWTLLGSHSCPTLHLLESLAIVVVVAGTTILHLLMTTLALQLTHQHTQGSNERDHILVAALVLRRFSLIIDTAVPDSLLLLLA